MSSAASGKPEPVESLLDEDDFAVIAEENLESPRDASDAAYTLVQNDEGDWMGLYGADGRLIAEGHSFPESELLRLVGVPHNRVWDVDMSDLGWLPATLGELAALGGTTDEVRP